MKEQELREQCESEFWKRHPMQKAKLDDPTYDSSHIMGKLDEFRRGYLAASTPLLERIAELEEQLRVRNEQMTRIGTALNPKAKSLLWENIAEGAVQRIEELEKDAARYQWLRNAANIDETIAVMDWRTNAWGSNYHMQISGDELDSTIDTALQHKEQTGEEDKRG